MQRHVFITGLQKSGTNLLVALLERSGWATRVSEGMEGGPVWQRPDSIPTEGPGGVVYQRYKGERGHEFSGEDATLTMRWGIRRLMKKQLARRPPGENQISFNKNPYNSVRIPFLRTVFSDAVIVAVIRRPVPNCYSLLKIFQADNTYYPDPVEGWWGVKPSGWRDLVSDDKLVQLARQWVHVNKRMLTSGPDLVLWYHKLCADPGIALSSIWQLACDGSQPQTSLPGKLYCCDDEPAITGSTIMPKSRLWQGEGSLSLDSYEQGKPEFPPLTDNQLQTITAITGDTEMWAQENYPG